MGTASILKRQMEFQNDMYFFFAWKEVNLTVYSSSLSEHLYILVK
jgi:hypothetical protein